MILLPSQTDYMLPTATSYFVPAGVQVHGQDGQPRPTIVGDHALAPLLPNGSNITVRHLEIRNDWTAVELSQGIVVRDVIGISSEDGATSCTWLGTGTLTDSVCWASGASNTRGGGSNTSGGTITATLRNVTAVGSASGLSFSVNNSNTASTVDAKNVIAMGGVTDVVASATGGTTTMTVTMAYSNYDTQFGVGSGTVTAPGTGTNQISPPSFVDAANGDFHQAPGSPTIGVGVIDPANGPVDIDGQSRNHGGLPDIGADEFDAAPAAVADSPSVAEDSPPSALGLLANDTDSDGGQKAIQSRTDPAHGIATIVSGGGDVEYEPAGDYCGPDSFTYTLNGGSATTVSITVTCVDDAPLAVADSATVGEDAAPTPIAVLANDPDVDGGPKSVVAKTNPAHGTAALAGGGSGVSYQPVADYCGPDSFTYTLNGGSTATVAVTVTCVPPNTSVLKKPPKVTRRRKAKFRFGSTESGSTFLCKLDRKPYRRCTSPKTFIVRPGKHRLRVKAIDTAGTPDATPASYRWRVLRPR